MNGLLYLLGALMAAAGATLCAHAAGVSTVHSVFFGGSFLLVACGTTMLVYALLNSRGK